MHAIDANGDVVWTADVGDEIRAAPLWTGEVVVVLPRGDTAYAFTPTGEQAWTLSVDNHRGATLVRMASPVQHPSGDVLLATMAGNVHRLTPNGETVWTTTIGQDDAVETAPAVTPEGDVVAGAFEPGREGRGLLTRLAGDTGEQIWQRDVGSQVVGAPTAIADTLLVPLRDGNALQARSLADGSELWTTAFDSRVPASPSLHEGLAIVGDVRGTVRGVEVSGGKIAWEFNPLGDDPQVDLGSSGRYTIADSVAVDDRGVAWVPYWVFEAGCCPPTDSTASPTYRLDAGSGEMLDRRQDAKANHGPSLHATGVWTGSDEGGVRTFPTGPTLQLSAHANGGEVDVIVNTDRSGDWRITADDETLAEGQGAPPTVSSHELAPGTYTLAVTLDDATARDTVTVETADDGDEQDPDPAEEEPGTEDPTAGDEQPPADTGSEGPDQDTSDEEPEPVPTAALAALLGLALATGVRSRA